MKKNFYKFIKLIFVSAILLACVSCADSSKQNEEPEQTQTQTPAQDTTPTPDPITPPEPKPEDYFIGTWFWNYGYNQDLFANEIVTFCEDGTIDISRITPEDIEYDKGTYSIIDDAKNGATLLINLNWYKYIKEDYVEEEPNLNLNIYYALGELTKERLMFSRYRRDFSAMGGPTYEFDPPVFNDYSRIKNGTKEHLIGKWKFNKRGTPDATWEETWIFNEDGTMESFWSEGADSIKYKGMYEVLADENGSVLHQTLTQESADGTTYTTLTQPMEFWYDYLIDNENVINVNCTKDKIGGEEHIKNPAIENFYYRDLELEEVTYHWTIYTFKDYYLKGTDYKLLDLAKMYLFYGVPNNLLSQKLLGWEQKVSDKKEYWAKWALKCNKNLYDYKNGKYNHEFTLPVHVLAPDMELPAKGKKYKISFSGKASEDLNFEWGLRIADSSQAAEGWLVIGEDWNTITSNNKQFSDVFEIEINEDVVTTNIDEINFNLCYNPENFDKPITIEDFSFTVETIE